MTRKEVHFEDWGLVLHVPTSKTNQYRQREFLSPVASSESDLCLVRQLKVYWSGMELTDEFPIVSRENGNPIFYDTALKILKKWCHIARIVKEVAFHSLRRGTATYMSMGGGGGGVTLHDIKMEGDWQSLSVLLYLASPMDHRRSIDAFVSSTFP